MTILETTVVVVLALLVTIVLMARWVRAVARAERRQAEADQRAIYRKYGSDG